MRRKQDPIFKEVPEEWALNCSARTIKMVRDSGLLGWPLDIWRLPETRLSQWRSIPRFGPESQRELKEVARFKNSHVWFGREYSAWPRRERDP